MAVLSVRCVGGVAELRTNRSSFFSPMAKRGRANGGGGGQNKERLKCALHVTSLRVTVVSDLLFPEPPHAGNRHSAWNFFPGL
jgi:hypothetical protein